MPQEAVSTAVHPDDQMYRDNMDRYLSVGADAADRIDTLLALADQRPERILDLGCGCGRVTRHLRSRHPTAEIVASDLMPHAVSFCVEEFGAVAGPADVDFSAVFDEGFDLIWSGSLMTHLPEPAAIAMIDLMVRSLRPNGLAVWTTHGRYVDHVYQSGKWPYLLTPERLEEAVTAFRDGSYSYVDYEHRVGYGISITPISWLAEQLSARDDVRIVAAIERGWDDHQDVIALRKQPIGAGLTTSR